MLALFKRTLTDLCPVVVRVSERKDTEGNTIQTTRKRAGVRRFAGTCEHRDGRVWRSREYANFEDGNSGCCGGGGGGAAPVDLRERKSAAEDRVCDRGDEGRAVADGPRGV